MNKKIKICEWIFFILSISLTIFIIVSSCLPGSASTKESGWLISLAKNIVNFFVPNAVNDGNIGVFSNFIRKFVGHFGLFLVDGICVCLTIYFHQIQTKKINLLRYFLITTSFGLLLAILTETIQLFVPHRSGQVSDVLIDFSGFLIAIFLIYIVILIKSKRKKE